jgi:glycosyltransferase involved in cell wall biosynthesis
VGRTDSRSLRIGFVMEQVVGHVTWYQNLRRAVTSLDEVEARWVETRLYEEDGLLERLPGLPSIVRAGGRAWLDVHRGLRGWPCDAILFNTQKAAMLCQWEMLHTPTLLMTDVTPIQYDRMAELYEHAPDRNPMLRLLKHQVNTLNFRLARALIPSSTWARESMIRDYGVPPERIHVIPIGTDTTYWRPPATPLANAKVQLLFVGGHFERKGGQLLVDVLRERHLFDHVDLHVVTREAVDPFPGMTVHHGLQNNSPELLRLYQSADLFVLPTLADCFGNASIEAMAVGLPVITTAIGGIPDIVEDGITGHLLLPGDGHALGEVIRRLVDDPGLRRSFSLAARRRALTHFDAHTNAARILDLARLLVEEHRASAARAAIH